MIALSAFKNISKGDHKCVTSWMQIELHSDEFGRVRFYWFDKPLESKVSKVKYARIIYTCWLFYEYI